MPISQTDQLFKLIKSLSKAEKRNFTIYSKRSGGSESSLFIQLFEFLDKQKHINDDLILKGMKTLKKAQLSNVKRHLYKQILISLRLIHIQRKPSIEIREYFDYAEILYSKGHYLQSLKILEKAKQLAIKNDFDIIVLEINEFQKIIESRHITRTGALKNVGLVIEAAEKIDQLSTMIKLSNLRLRVHGEYIRFGHIENEDEHERVKAFWNENVPEIDKDNLSYTSKIYLYQSYVWYYYILLDFKKCLEYAILWVNACKEFPESIARDPDLFMRGYHYVLTSAYNIGDVQQYLKYSEELELFRTDNYKSFSMNTQIMSFMYVHHGRLNQHFLLGTFSEGIQIIPRTLKRIKRYRDKLDAHRILVFYFKIAWMHFGNEDYEEAINFLNRILHYKFGSLRQDIQGYSRILFLMCHYELENYDILEYLYKSVRKFFDGYEEKNQVQECVMDFFKDMMNMPLSYRMDRFMQFEQDLITLKNNPFVQRPFLYLNVLDWTTSKIQRVPMAKIIQKNAIATQAE